MIKTIFQKAYTYLTKRDNHIKHAKKNKTLFIVKERTEYYGHMNSSGLLNSAKFVVDELKKRGYDVLLEQVVDHNSIDRVVTQHRPTHVIIEAFWVTPAKFAELQKIHKTVKWFVRNHSKADFAAQEGMIYEWTIAYEKLGVHVGYNLWSAKETADDGLNKPFNLPEALYFPNVYYPRNDAHENRHHVRKLGPVVHVGCFGAVRPLKNQIQQFLAAIGFANKYNRYLKFYINNTRTESGGAPILKSLRAIGAELELSGKGKLIEIPWQNHAEFLDTIALMDVVMQVSYSETFNIVAADAVSNNVPVVVSDEVFWASSDKCLDPRSQVTVKPSDVKGMTEALEVLASNDKLRNKILNAQFEGIEKYNEESIIHWERFLA